MDTEKININFSEGLSKAELIIREGEAVKELEPKAPIKTNLSGVLSTPLEYLKKRVATGQFLQERSHIIVNRENVSISLIINENDDYERGEIKGTLDFHPKFKEFGINEGKVWTPSVLGMFFKMNRTFFPDKTLNMKLVSDLMNFTAKVSNKIEMSLKESGSKTDNYEQVVNSNLPEKFTLQIPIFKGKPAENLEIETFAQINGREVAFILISPSANQLLEDIRDKAIDEEIAQIKEVAPKIVIIEV